MRLPALLAAILLCPPAIAAASDAASTSHDAHGHRPSLSSTQCGLSTGFSVLADSGGIWLYRDTGTPREIFFHDGALSVDQQVRATSAADAQRLRALEAGARALMPQVAGIARDVVDISYDALAGVIDVMTGSTLNAWKVQRSRKRALAYVDATLGKGRWDQTAFDGNFERYVEQQAETFKGSIGRHLLWQVATGRADAIEARADRMGDTLDARLEERSRQLEAKALALCDQAQALRQLQDALDYRYHGEPLPILGVAAAPRAPDAEDAPTANDGEHGDHPASPAIRTP
jgi:hypothetical protein